MSADSTERTTQDRDYFSWRASECLRMADEAAEPGAANIHRRMAEQYQAKALAV